MTGTNITTPPRRPWLAHPDLIALLMVLLAVLATRLPALNNPLTDAYAFRQTQTAWTSLLFAQQGIDLLHPQVPVFGFPFALPLEFPLFQAMASLLIQAGLGPDLADRLMALFCFMAATVAVYRLGLRLSERSTAIVATLFFSFSPFAIIWSQASLIEFLAVGLALWYLETSLAAISSHGRRQWILAVVAAVLGTGAMLVKSTTGVFWILPVAVALLMGRPHPALRRSVLSAMLLLVPIAFGVLWFEVSSEIRHQNPFAYALNDQMALSWFFGTITQRLDPGTWIAILGRAWMEIGGLFLPLLLILGWLERRQLPQRWQRAVWVSLGMLALAAPLLLVNVYYVHDYYLIAVLPALVLYIGLGVTYIRRRWDELWARLLVAGVVLAWLFALATSLGLAPEATIAASAVALGLFLELGWATWRGRSRYIRAGLAISAIVLPLLGLGTCLGMSVMSGQDYVLRVYVPPQYDQYYQVAAARIATLVPADRWVALITSDPPPNDLWNPTYFYYARREGIMIIDPVRNLGGLRMVCADPRYVLLSISPAHVVSRASCPDGKVIP